jgi:hypothetical protein
MAAVSKYIVNTLRHPPDTGQTICAYVMTRTQITDSGQGVISVGADKRHNSLSLDKSPGEAVKIPNPKKIRYSVKKCMSPAPILGKRKPVHFNIILGLILS